MSDTVAERFWAKVRVAPGCWIWVGCRNSANYGHMGIGSRTDGSRRTMAAHRVSWELHNGPIPEGLCVLHHCDNPPCVNPAHLFLGTDADNVADRDAKGRQVLSHTALKNRAATHCPQGHPYDEANTYRYRGARQCMTCRRRRDWAKRKTHRRGTLVRETNP